MAPGIHVDSLGPEILPEEGAGALATLKFFEEQYAHLITNSAGPRYFGFVTGGSTPAAVAGDWLVSAYDQNTCGSNDSIAPQIERQTIDYLRQLFGLGPEYSGSFVTGATMSNFVGLALARQWVGEQCGVDVSLKGLGNLPIKVVSGTPHSSILKSMSMLGLGRDSIHRIETLPDREAVDVTLLQKFLRETSDPVIIVANAGTVNTGDFDDLAAIAALKDKYNFWLHVDGAFGAFAVCSQKFRHRLNGLNKADSFTVDAHKWLNVPYDSAMQFTRHPLLQLKIFQNNAAYLGDPLKNPDFFHYTPESSRRWRALPAWFSLRAYGKKGYQEIVERNCSLAERLGNYISNSHDFLLLSEVRLNIVCFTLRVERLDASLVRSFLEAVREDGRVFFTPTEYKGSPAIRAAVSNWQTIENDIDVAFESLTRVFLRWKQTIPIEY
jgi:glutamate/tyrosine decarboxylase-like PLP-dependent enzyme